MRHLRPGDRGDDVAALQAALNERSRARHFATLNVDGDYGIKTDIAVERIARVLGARERTIRKPGATVGEQRIIRWPLTRTPAQLARARKRATAKPAPAAHGAEAALNEARRWIGKTEQPYGSNTAPWGLGQWIKELLGLNYGVAWCGVYVGHCLKTAGVPVTSRVASVYNVWVDAGNGTNGFVKRVGLRDGQPGDVVGLFGLSTHEALIEKRVPGGYQTCEGNTSSGPGGSQSNGGGCFRRVRPYSAVVYVARPRY